MDILKALSTLSMIASSITAIIACLLLISKPLRNYLLNKMIKQTEDKEQKEMIRNIHKTLIDHIEKNSLQNEALMSLLRTNITNTYYKYINCESVPMYVKENLVKEYCIYHQFNGNGFIDVIYEELMAKPPIN